MTNRKDKMMSTWKTIAILWAASWVEIIDAITGIATFGLVRTSFRYRLLEWWRKPHPHPELKHLELKLSSLRIAFTNGYREACEMHAFAGWEDDYYPKLYSAFDNWIISYLKNTNLNQGESK
jgi:hypothetical protein